MANTAEVRNGHLWTNLIEFDAFLYLKGLNERFFDTICT